MHICEALFSTTVLRALADAKILRAMKETTLHRYPLHCMQPVQ